MRRGRPLEPVTLVLCFSWLVGVAPAAAAPKGHGAAQLLTDLQADTEHRTALTVPLDKARQALARAHAMDQAGDGRHAALLRTTARVWLDAAADLVRAADAEANAERTEKDVIDLETKRARGRALLEETIARRGRAEALLEQLEREAKIPAPTDARPDAKKAAAEGKGKAGKPVGPAAAAPVPLPARPGAPPSVKPPAANE